MNKSIKSEFERLHRQRFGALQRKRDCAALTIPGLLPDEGLTEDSPLPIPFNSLPARGVASLAAKIVSAVDPANDTPWAEIDTTPAENDPRASERPELLVRIKQVAANLDRQIHRAFGVTNYRPELFVAFQHLIAIGDYMLHMTDDREFVGYRIDQYVVRRTVAGAVDTIIIREYVDPELLPENMKSLGGGTPRSPVRQGLEEHFTRISRKLSARGKVTGWSVEKEFRDTIYEKDREYKTLPYLPLRWSVVTGWSYGRSLVEENYGDIMSAESLTKSLLEGAAANAEFRMGVNPGGVAQVDDIESSDNGSCIAALPDDVFPITANLNAQVQQTQAALDMVNRSLARVFLMDSALQPQGERVTATQVRILAAELENALGGIFSALAREIQLPCARRMIELMQRDGEIQNVDVVKALDGGILAIRVRTGLEALGKEIQAAKMTANAQFVTTLPEPAQVVMDWENYLRDYWTASGLDSRTWVKTSERVAQERQQALAQQTAALAAQQAIQSTGRIAEKQAPAA